MKNISVNSSVEIVGNFPCNYPDDTIKNEPIFFRSSFDFAYDSGGVITRGFLDSLPDYVKNQPISFDSRVHMLMPTWIPAIAGWHHDDVPRSLPNGQPNYESPEYESEHIIGLVNAHISPTEFALGCENFPILKEEVYKHYNQMVDESLLSGSLKSFKSESGLLYFFDYHTWHRATVAEQRGWRWFGRVSWGNESCLSPRNDIRRQVQVYLTSVNEGWYYE